MEINLAFVSLMNLLFYYLLNGFGMINTIESNFIDSDVMEVYVEYMFIL